MTMRQLTRLMLVVGGLLGLAACSMIRGTTLEQETVRAACGMCIFGQSSNHGCYWAIEWDGEYYPVNGETPIDHESHGPEGMCIIPRQAVVTGLIRGGQLLADDFELLPVNPNDLPAQPRIHQHQH
jgi:hypothetical protein